MQYLSVCCRNDPGFLTKVHIINHGRYDKKYIGETCLRLGDWFRQHLNDKDGTDASREALLSRRHHGKRDISVTAICSYSSNERSRTALEQRLIFLTDCLHSGGINNKFSLLLITLHSHLANTPGP